MPTTIITEAQFNRNMLDSQILATLTGVDPMQSPVAPNGSAWLHARLAN